MFDIWIGDMNLTILMLIVSVAIILPVQLLLCFKGKSRVIRFIPIIILFLLAVVAIVMYNIAIGWDGLIFVFCAIYAAFMMLICGLGWGVWAIVNFIKSNKDKAK